MKLPLSAASPDSAPELAKPSLPTTWLILHALFCATSMAVGFRFSRLVVFLLFLPTPPLNPAAHLVSLVTPPLTLASSNATATITTTTNHTHHRHHHHHSRRDRSLRAPPGPPRPRLRPQVAPPDPSELLKAHHILAAVQTAQRSSSRRGNGPPRPVIAITPTVIAKINGEASTPTLSAPPRRATSQRSTSPRRGRPQSRVPRHLAAGRHQLLLKMRLECCRGGGGDYRDTEMHGGAAAENLLGAD
ncbi:probable glucuronosyltransferase Os04g0650300 [Lolium perenne]|uniref:probable glucuronosyltransferase Os04g0650300 n=1 Tax=Lolium perenne TaxID=4522 RepID=UPI0021EAA620